MIFHENRLPADHSHEISCPICYFWKSGKIWNCRLLQIVGGALWVNPLLSLKESFLLLHSLCLLPEYRGLVWFDSNTVYYGDFQTTKHRKNVSFQKSALFLCSHGCTVKPVLSGHSERRRKLFLKTDYRLMQVKSIAECSKGSILQYLWPSLSYHLSLRSLWVTT